MLSNKILVLLAFVELTQAIQILMKTNSWYCFEVISDKNAQIDVDYMVTGINPEQVNFQARQSGQILADRDQQRSAIVDVKSMMDNAMLQLCWQKTDKKSKKLDFAFKRNTALSDEAADLNTLDSLKDDLALLKDELEGISRNI